MTDAGVNHMQDGSGYHSLAKRPHFHRPHFQIVPWPLENHTVGYRLVGDLLTSDLRE